MPSSESRRKLFVWRMLTLVAVVAASLAGPALVSAQGEEGSGPNNVVNVSNTVDATKQTRAAVRAGATAATRTTPTNLASARSFDCSGCESLAAAYQAVFITGDPEYFSPRNAAVAGNSDCHACGAFAYAYQYVVDTDGPARLSEAGREKIAAVRNEANRLLDSGLPYGDLEGALHDLAQRFRATIDAELRRSGVEVEDRQARERTRQTG